jgi:hypothetical protein
MITNLKCQRKTFSMKKKEFNSIIATGSLIWDGKKIYVYIITQDCETKNS